MTTTTPTSATPSPRLRVALNGFGNQNKEMAKMLVERNDVEIVAVISNKSNVGKDFGEIIGFDTPYGVLVTGGSEASEVLKKTRPQVAMLSTLSTVGDIESQLRVCAENQVNVVTIAEELLFSWTSAPEKTQEMHDLFEKNNVSLIGSGFIDGACCDMTRTMAAMMHRIEKLEGGLQYNVDQYGKVLAIAHGVGLTEEEFYAPETGPGLTSPTSYPKSYVYNSNEWFAAALGLTVAKTEEVKSPTKASVELYSEAIDRTIPIGQCTGMTVTATTTTKEGVTIIGKQVGKCYEKDDEDWCAWNLEGNPGGVGFTMKAPPTPAMTNTAAISRMFQAVEAPAGYITTDKLPTMAGYVHKCLTERGSVE
uniref:Dihydrodipicolinate reductase N-terminal domain-containing protein n=1 Tax=Helicotheca tamesis TaxID=374047 RepID=A0A7S2MPR1_9STRA|mmetsp:Transcript_19612/g.26923  ORF Transcript_19612/g.26923 Transcript_19612/m.26923 type:complete len:365 (+) Transcript_19612:58-1152(+)